MNGDAPSPAIPEDRPLYDLVTEVADYPAWEGPPARTVLLCSHPRAGSTLLGEAIYDAGGLGCPIEYLHRGFRPALAERWHAPDLTAYVRALHRWRTDPSGILSSKLFWRDLEESAEESGSGTTPRKILETVFPNPMFIHLRRRDRVRQAVSAFAAQETKLFRALGQDEDRKDRQIIYSYEGILRQLAASDGSQARWRRFFDEHRIVPLEVWYEDLANDYEGAVRRVLAFILQNSGGEVARVKPPRRPRLRRQADATSEVLLARFLRDHAAAGRRNELS